AAVGGLHDAGTAAGHHREASASQALTDLARLDVILMLGRETRRAEHRDTRTEEMKTAEAAQDLEEDAKGSSQFKTAFLRSLEELPDLRDGRRFAPVGRRGRRARFRLLNLGAG